MYFCQIVMKLVACRILLNVVSLDLFGTNNLMNIVFFILCRMVKNFKIKFLMAS